MPLHYEATSDFDNSVSEVETLITLASADEENRILFLKLSVVSLVTKFQVFIEKVLAEFRYNLNNTPSRNLSTYIKMNSLRLSVMNRNTLTGLPNHKIFTEEKKSQIVQYLSSISYISDDNYKIGNEFFFNTKFPLGKTGKKELLDLLIQIDGDTDPFAAFGNDKFNKIDSVLQTRHSIIHQDRFSGTETTVQNDLDFLKELVHYIDQYLYTKMQTISPSLPE